jgi:hypothetical protein
MSPRPKPYLHDRLILLILSINTFLAAALIISSLLPLSDTGSGYIREYRSNLGLDGYLAGDVKDIVSFAVFAVIVYTFQLITSIKVYHIHKRFSIIILLLALITFIFGLLASRALLSLS